MEAVLYRISRPFWTHKGCRQRMLQLKLATSHIRRLCFGILSSLIARSSDMSDSKFNIPSYFSAWNTALASEYCSGVGGLSMSYAE